MIYNKMHHMLNDESQKRKRQINGSRNLNTQAKLMITQPSQYSFSIEGDNSHIASSPLRGKLSLPPVISPASQKDALISVSVRNTSDGPNNSLFEMQPTQKSVPAGKPTEDLETMIRRKGKIQFSNNSMLKLPRPEDEEDILLSFR